MRTIEKDGNTYVCVDDLARAMFNVADDIRKGRYYEDQVAAETTERIAYSIVGGNLVMSNIAVVVDRPEEG